MANFKFDVISANVISQVLHENLHEAYELIKNTYLFHHRLKAKIPKSQFLRFDEKPNARIIALPAYINQKDNKVSGIKWISSYPENITKGYPRASAVIILNDFETGYPFACIEGSQISALRTACSAVLAAEYISLPSIKIQTLGIVGTGPIAKNIHMVFNAKGWHIENIILFDKELHYAESFKQYLQARISSSVTIASSLEELIKSSNTIIFATTAAEPHFSDISLIKHKPCILHISLRDVAPEIIASANNITDDIEHVLDANTSPHLAYQQYQHKDFMIGTIAGLIDGDCKIDKNKAVIFSPMGMGILDIALANYVHRIATIEGKTDQIHNFFLQNG